MASFLRRRHSSTSSNGDDYNSAMIGLRTDRRHSDDDRFSRGARRMFRVLAERDPRLTTKEGLQRLFDEVDTGGVETQEELLERMFNTAELEEHIDSSAVTPEDENVFVESILSQVAEDADEKEESKIKPPRRKITTFSKFDNFVEYLLQKINQQWLSLIYAVFPFHQVQTLVFICLVQFVRSFTVTVSYAPCAHGLHLVQLNGLLYSEDVSKSEVYLSVSVYRDKSEPGNVCLRFSIQKLRIPKDLLADAHDRYALFGIFANLVSWSFFYPNILSNIPAEFISNFSSLPVMLSRMRISIGYWRLWRPFLQFRLGYLIVSLGIPSLCLLSIPVVYVLMAYRRKTWSDVLHSIVPHIVTIVWSDVAMTLLMIGWKSFGISWAKAAITLLVLVSPFIVVKCYNYLSNRYKFSISPSNPEKRKWIMFGIYFSTLLMAISFLYEGQMTFDPSADVTNMTWTQYDRHCSLSSANTIENQIRCSQLKGTAINWKGTVQSVRVVNIDNSFETLLGYLPESIGQTLRCFYDSNRTTEDVEGMRANECSLTEHNMYTFEIEVSGPYGERIVSSAKGQLVLSAGHVFYEMLRLVDEGDVVRFIAFFDQYPVFRYPPRLKLLQLECANCNHFQKGQNGHLRLTNSKMSRTGLWHQVFNAFKFCFNFMFAPLIRVK
ncbi:unnamed protein product [Nippostrongylus brasiliensis]|uniref:Wolframin (inferred by orthology to a human protein) n=2 Tax=Nippostrongylus brasiliensis TaxID=27835 RepID=A0A0N4XD48_NIPBR|nr:unnamed protein product [Nippostrongylus brasiliensis]